jgi:hypothetical protein
MVIIAIQAGIGIYRITMFLTEIVGNMGFQFLLYFQKVLEKKFPQGFVKIIEVFDVLKDGAAPVLSSSGIFERDFIAIDEGKIADLGKDFDCVGLIGYAKTFFVPELADLLIIGQKRLFLRHFPSLQ